MTTECFVNLLCCRLDLFRSSPCAWTHKHRMKHWAHGLFRNRILLSIWLVLAVMFDTHEYIAWLSVINDDTAQRNTHERPNDLTKFHAISSRLPVCSTNDFSLIRAPGEYQHLYRLVETRHEHKADQWAVWPHTHTHIDRRANTATTREQVHFACFVYS